MHEIEVHEMSQEFFRCWQAAGKHLDNQVQGGIRFWLRAHPYPPFLDHLSFRLGNQLFFVRVEDVDGMVAGPGSFRGLHTIAKANGGHALVLPMKRRMAGDTWVSDRNGWGLIDATTRETVDPVALVTDDKIEMTPWELQDMAVQVMRDYLEKQGYELMSWQSNPEVEPAIWFVGDSREPEWVVVRAVRYPERQAQRPDNWPSIENHCARMSRVGHFASVAIASAEQPFQTSDEPATPLWRGHALHIRFTGLE